MSRNEWIHGGASETNDPGPVPDPNKPAGRSAEAGTTRDGGTDQPPPVKEQGRGV